VVENALDFSLSLDYTNCVEILTFIYITTHIMNREKTAKSREIISLLSKYAPNGLLNVETASKALEIDSRKTSIRLSALSRRGWIQRVKRGLYYILPLEAKPGQETMIDDPFILANQLFKDFYIGGWSAAEYWALTDQIFNSVFIVTTENLRAKTISLFGYTFNILRVTSIDTAGLKKVWRKNIQIQISTPERMIADSLRNPSICGGIRTLASIISEYDKKTDKNYSDLIKIIKKIGNGATWKRLGYIFEELKINEDISKIAEKEISSGAVRLDPSIKSRGDFVKKWGLWINTSLS